MYQLIGINIVWYRCQLCHRLVKRIEWVNNHPVCLTCHDQKEEAK